MDGGTPSDERDELMAAFRRGDYSVLVNVGVATEGLDVPGVSAVVMARPTKSIILWLQMAGRALRPGSSPS